MIFENERIYNDRKEYTELDKSIRDKSYKTKFLTGETVKDVVFVKEKEAKQDIIQQTRICQLNSFSKRIIRKAVNKSPFYTEVCHFDESGIDYQRLTGYALHPFLGVPRHFQG